MRSFCSASMSKMGLILSFLFLTIFSVALAEDIEIDLGGNSGASGKSTPVPADQKKTATADQPVTAKKEAAPNTPVSEKPAKKTASKSVIKKVFFPTGENNENKVLFEGDNLPKPTVDKISGMRILVKFANAQLRIPLKISGDKKLIKSIRSSMHPGPTAWIVLDLLKDEEAAVEPTEKGYSLSLGSTDKAADYSAAVKQDKKAMDNEKPVEKSLFSRLIDASFKPVDKGIKIVLTSDGLSKYTVRKLSQPTKLVMRFHNTKLDINDKFRNVKASDEEVKKGGFVQMELRQIGPSFSPISEAIVTLLPGTSYQIDRDLNQVVLTLSAPVAAEKPMDKHGNANQLVSLDIEGADINAVVKTLAAESGFDVDFVAGPLVGVVNERFKDVPLKTALATLLAPGNYDFEIQGNTLRFGTQGSLKSSKGILPHVTEIIHPGGGLTPDGLDALVKSILKPSNAITTKTDTVRNVLIINGTPSDVEDYKRTMQDLKLDEGAGGDRITRVVKLNYSVPSDLSDLLKKYLTPVGQIQIDAPSSSLVIWETASNMGVLLELIKELDHKPAQVLIESTILEVDSENDLDMGVNWSANKITGDPTMNATINLPPGNAVVSPGIIGFGTVKNGLNINAQIQALETHKKGKVISRPRIATASGQQAKIQETENVVVTNLIQNISTTGTIQQTLQTTTFPLPIELTVTPRITDDGRITTKIEASITSQSGPAGSTGQPPTNVQTATTTITTKNGETIVIGGLVREVAQETVNGIPLLSSIPIIGALFQQKDKTNRKEELIIFITPTLLEE